MAPQTSASFFFFFFPILELPLYPSSLENLDLCLLVRVQMGERALGGFFGGE